MYPTVRRTTPSLSKVRERDIRHPGMRTVVHLAVTLSPLPRAPPGSRSRTREALVDPLVLPPQPGSPCVLPFRRTIDMWKADHTTSARMTGVIVPLASRAVSTTWRTARCDRRLRCRRRRESSDWGWHRWRPWTCARRNRCPPWWTRRIGMMRTQLQMPSWTVSPVPWPPNAALCTQSRFLWLRYQASTMRSPAHSSTSPSPPLELCLARSGCKRPSTNLWRRCRPREVSSKLSKNVLRTNSTGVTGSN